MKKMLVALCASLLFASTATYAAKAPSEKQLAQQQRMKDCNAEAKTKALKGADRKAFMKTCLSGGSVSAEAAAPAAPAAAAPAADAAAAPADKKASQKEKMKSCNADATGKGLKGADRKTFMSTCLSAG